MTIVDDRLRTATFLWLDISRACNLACSHCYNGSGPDGGHGAMRREDWLNVLDQAAVSGVRMVQLIGGEPVRRSLQQPDAHQARVVGPLPAPRRQPGNVLLLGRRS
jgi:molybdenum cofactor biosynthesis enzyme MoaA